MKLPVPKSKKANNNSICKSYKTTLQHVYHAKKDDGMSLVEPLFLLADSGVA
jgi:hypothetical protein